MHHPGWSRFLLAAAALVVASVAQAADLRIGVASEATTLDPHFFHLTPNTEIHKGIYSAIVTLDAKQNIIPDLATSWRVLDPTHWEFKLRPGVVFHDGTPLTAEDVAFTYKRARNVPGSPASFQQFLKHVVGVATPDADHRDRGNRPSGSDPAERAAERVDRLPHHRRGRQSR